MCLCGRVFVLSYSHWLLFVSTVWIPASLCGSSVLLLLCVSLIHAHPSSHVKLICLTHTHAGAGEKWAASHCDRWLFYTSPFIPPTSLLLLLLLVLPALTSYYCGLLATADAVIIIAVVVCSLHQGCAVIWTNCDEMSLLLHGWKTLVGTHGAGSGIKNVDWRGKRERWMRMWCLFKLHMLLLWSHSYLLSPITSLKTNTFILVYHVWFCNMSVSHP